VQTEQIKVLAQVHSKSEWAGLGLPVAGALTLFAAAIIGLLSSPETVLVPIVGLGVAVAYLYLSYRRPIRIWVLLIRNTRRRGRPLVWLFEGKVTVLDSRVFCEPVEDVRLELSEHDGTRVQCVRFVGKKDRTTIWSGYFEPRAEEFVEDFRKMQARGGGLSTAA
jgi:hypothetical protein